MDPSAFYSQSNSQVLKTRFKSEQKLFELYQVFKTQKEAFEYCDRLNTFIAIFSFEFDQSKIGSRKFVVCSLHDFWARYKLMTKGHYYELIRTDSPCHLYFDLEFDFDLNPTANGSEMLQTFIELVFQRLHSHLNLPRKRIKTVKLHSSSQTKFSYHLLFKNNEYCFRNNQDVGVFVHSMVEEWKHSIASKTPNYQTYLSLFVFNKQGELVPFVDTSVYSKNRNFRLWRSSKIGKDRILEIEGVNFDFETFKESLVCDYEKISNHFNIATSINPYKPSKVITSKIESFEKRPQNMPSPLIESFILSSIIRDEKANIQSALYYKQSNTLLITIRGNRFCNRIRRQHRSNQIYYVANLNTGQVFQRCFDPDCRNFSFPVQSLPSWMLNGAILSSTNDDAMFNEIDDSAFAKIQLEYADINIKIDAHPDDDNYMFDEIDDSEIAKVSF